MRVIITVLILTLASQAEAEIFICSLENHKAQGEYRGGPNMKELLYDRLGTQIKFDSIQNTISTFRRNRWQRPVQVEKITKTKKFTTYLWYKRGRFETEQDRAKGREPTGPEFSMAHRLRIDNYDFGKLTIKRQGNFVTIEAKGKCNAGSVTARQANIRPRSVNIVQEIQKELNRLNCNVGSPDGAVGPASIRGLRQFSKANKTFAYDKSVFSDPNFLKLLNDKRSGFCNR